MLTNRQKSILNILVVNYSKALITTSSILAYELEVTTKTIQNDIKNLKKQLEKYNTSIDTIPGKGYKLSVISEKDFLNVIELISNEQDKESLFDNKDERLKFIIGTFLFSNKPVLSDKLSNQLYISRSQLSIDIKEVKKVLKKYDLIIVSKSKQGLIVEGSEYNKRQCIIKEGINWNTFNKNMFIDFSRAKLSKYVLDAISYEKYEISDFNLQNFIIYVETTIVRIKWGAALDDYNDNIVEFPNTHEYRIVQNIFKNISKQYGVQANDFEISNLAIIIKSIRIKNDNTVIDERTDLFVAKLIQTIRKQFVLDFSNDIELRINLGLHITSLLERAKNKALSENNLLNGIKQSLTLAYDIAMVSTCSIEKEYKVKLSENETGYIAVYFAMALNHMRQTNNKKRVLIITSSRKSEALLLRHNFLSRFGDHISVLDIIQANELDDVIAEDYDCVFATVFPGFVDALKFDVIHINYFLDDKNIAIIENVLIENTLKDKFLISPLINFFPPKLFFHNVKAKNKYELISFLCDKMNNLFHFDEHYQTSLYENIIQRENNAPTVFTNSVALPHPEVPFTDETTTAVAVLDEPIIWDESKIQIVFLLNIQKDGEKEMEALYEFISEFISNKNLQTHLKTSPTYETLKSLVVNFKPKNNYNL